MRLRLCLLLLPCLFFACSKTAAPVRLDFIGTTGLTSSNRTVGPGDTLTTRAYAVGNDNALTHLRVTVKYEPTRNPISYPTPLSGYDPTKATNDDPVAYLDSVIVPVRTGGPRGGEFVLLNKFAARTTSGTELWQYTATDDQLSTASRAYRLTVRKPDSAAVFHSYSALLRPAPAGAVGTGPRAVRAADSLRDQARAFLVLRSGLLLPKYALLNQQNSLLENQLLIDLICVAANGSISLSAPAAAALTASLNAGRWPVSNRRVTLLKKTGLSDTDFANARTTAAFTAAFTAGTAFPGVADGRSTGPLAKGAVVAFLTADNLTGLMLIADLTTGTTPLLNCSIKVQKQ